MDHDLQQCRSLISIYEFHPHGHVEFYFRVNYITAIFYLNIQTVIATLISMLAMLTILLDIYRQVHMSVYV